MIESLIVNNFLFIRNISNIQSEEFICSLLFINTILSLGLMGMFGYAGYYFGNLYINKSIDEQYLYLSIASLLGAALNAYHILTPGSLLISSSLGKFLIFIYWFLVYGLYILKGENSIIFYDVKESRRNNFYLSTLNFFLGIFSIVLIVNTKIPGLIIPERVSEIILLGILLKLILFNSYFIAINRKIKASYVIMLIFGCLSLFTLVVDFNGQNLFGPKISFFCGAFSYYFGQVFLLIYLFIRIKMSNLKSRLFKDEVLEKCTQCHHHSHSPIILYQDPDYLK